MTNIRIGTRGSDLALWQAHEVARKLAGAGYASTIVKVRTTGDKRQDVPLAAIGGKGLFVKELEEALDRREIDIAVHSLKDVPSIIPRRFVLASFLERADPRDVWISRNSVPIAALRTGAVIGTSSPRRRAQLLPRFPHLVFEPVRGNIDTRINKVRDGVLDGIVLACAGLQRLGRLNEITSYFAVDELVPAAGQGVIAIETRADATVARDAAAKINHGQTELRVRCERGVLQHFDEQIGCDSAIAVHAIVSSGVITIRAVAADRDGGKSISVIQSGADPARLASTVYDELVEKGAIDLILAITEPPHPPSAPSRRATERRTVDGNGRVYLVGAGPGDPGLLTLRAAELIATAEFVAIDALVSSDIAAMIPKSAEVVYVGKRSRNHAVPQTEITQLLIEHAQDGKRVVRLKGGDPFVFGRGGEEAQDLMEAGVPVEIVPGISSAIAGPAYAGIPITHRDYSNSVTLVTGHESDVSKGIHWQALAQLDGTIVFMMGFANLALIVERLIAHGMPRHRAVAVISNATRHDQRTVAGTLETIVRQVATAEMVAPALIVVGEVVRLHDALNWFESEPVASMARTIV